MHRLPQHVESRELRHALVGQREGDRVAPRLELLQKVDRAAARVSAENAIVFSVFAAQIAFHRPQDFRLIVDSENGRCWHVNKILWIPPRVWSLLLDRSTIRLHSLT